MVHRSAALRLALWIGRGGKGSAVLRFGQGQLVLHLVGGHITAIEGNDGEILAAAFGLPPEGEWFAEARSAVAQKLVTPEEAGAVLKRALTQQLRAFFLAPDAEVEIFPGEPRPAGGFVISYPHVVYEMVLREGGEALVGVFLPDTSGVLRRLPGFTRKVSELQLPEEALAILAKINDARSVEAIAEPSPHGRELVLRLLAATVGAGLVELELPTLDEQPPALAEAPGEAPRKRRWWLWLLLALLLLGAAAAYLFYFAPQKAASLPASGPWSIAVGGACQPAELELLYRLQAKDKQQLRVVPFGSSSEPCYRLVWGRFASQQEAERALATVPENLVQKGFAPHAVLVGNSSP
jgi:hypothetical protein